MQDIEGRLLDRLRLYIEKWEQLIRRLKVLEWYSGDLPGENVVDHLQWLMEFIWKVLRVLEQIDESGGYCLLCFLPSIEEIVVRILCLSQGT